MTVMELCIAGLIMLYGVIFWLTHEDEEEKANIERRVNESEG